ncbi:hypothetical protein KQI30_03245 [Clostridium bornimense]|uniref:ATP cone domain-containing protein n=1 Tax=Clostridium bornimense TaxID=1216932 RepID=UPI001C12125F|nr:ATP cone domain-containing protein [Clostridium bornimense]MBU5315294.1 hypothetical protein [Clostridium bornimense]
MNVIKKDGSLQDLNIGKIETSIINASNDINFSLNSADIKDISNEIVTVLNKIRKDNTSTYELVGITIKSLIKLGFRDIAKSYFSHNLI